MPVSTEGGRTIITGTNFGPNGTNAVVFVANSACSDAIYTEDDYSISCIVTPGTGTLLQVSVEVGQQIVYSQAFSYSGMINGFRNFFSLLVICIFQLLF